MNSKIGAYGGIRGLPMVTGGQIGHFGHFYIIKTSFLAFSHRSSARIEMTKDTTFLS